MKVLPMVAAPMPVPPASFTGVWNARRKVVDHLARRSFVFDGIATISLDRFDEQGGMAIGERRVDARRTYGLDMSDSMVGVLFPDGRAFIEIDDRAIQRVEHRCGDDVYAGRIFFLDCDGWAEFWRVQGPRKRYTSLTRFTRRPG